LYIAWGVNGVNPWDKVSMVWLVGLYLIHTIGELCLSPIGLSMVVKLAPARFVSLLMGVWFLSTATANKFAGDLSALYPEEVKLELSAPTGALTAFEEIKKNPIDTAVWSLSAKEQFILKVADLQFNKDSVSSITTGTTSKEVSVYHLKLIKAMNSKIEYAAVSADGHYLAGYKKEIKKTRDGDKTIEKLEIYNLQPTKPSFLGMKIENLFDFFMIFVYLSGAAAILLYSINKWLLSKMHGIK
jgi:POT family proton-dependent oligopeptide transporter